MKKLMPMLIGLFGLAAGLGAGMALKPAPPQAIASACEAAPAAEGAAAAADGHAPAPCLATPDPFSPEKPAGKKKSEELAYVTMDKPFVVPVFAGEKVAAMVVVSLSVETDTESAHAIEDVKPRLRDGFLKVMFRHANSGGFDGSFTTGRKIEDLKSALLASAHEVVPDLPVDEVLITEIARQDS
ncbi:MAG: flagellar basal body-associated FliL family protein [Amaricoccus sp.]